MDNWFIEGEDPTREKFIKDAYRPTIFNFWLKENETREVVFIDDAKFGVYEHVIPWQGKYKNFTCSGAECVLCGMEKNRSYKEYYTILDLTPFKDKDNKDHKYSRKALAVPKDISEILKSRRSDNGGTLQGVKFKVTRSGKKSFACGNDWVAVSKVDMSKIPKDIKPYEFREVLRPRSSSEIQAMLKFNGGGEAPKTMSRDSLAGGADSMDQTSTFTEDEIPF